MPSELVIPLPVLYGFLLVLARISGVFAFVPFPGGSNYAVVPRVALSVACTLALFNQWPTVETEATPALLTMWVMAEAALGLAVGVAVSFLAEALLLGMQALSLQAGYGYASTIDPNTNADSGILLVMAQLLAGLLFFAFGLDRQILAVFAASLERFPPASFTLTPQMPEAMIRLGATIFTTGLRLAMPVIGLLLLVDIALALLGRVNAQMQLITLAFPAKMAVTLLVLSSVLLLVPTLYRGHAEMVMRTVHSLLTP
jgi:flagellar biosynthetic protein FliR